MRKKLKKPMRNLMRNPMRKKLKVMDTLTRGVPPSNTYEMTST
jgi:hypothetical protein